MSYNGSGTFVINSAGQPVVTGTVISSTAFNALTADLATGLSTAITKDGQTTTTARILFAQGVSSTLVTDATSATTGSIITAGGISMQKALWVGTTSRHVGATQFDAAITYGGVTLSNSVTGTGSMVLSASPTLTGTVVLPYTNGGISSTGIGTTGASAVPFMVSSTEVARFDTSGNLTVATTTVYNAAKISTNGKIAALGSFGSTKLYNGSIATATATTVGTVVASVNNEQTSVKIKISATDNTANQGYAGVYEEWNIIYGSFGGSYTTPTVTNMTRSQFSVNSGVIAVTTTVTAVLSGVTLLIKVTANGSGSVGCANVNLTAQMELVGSAYSNTIS